MYIVYTATNKINNKIYIGISKRTLEKRIYYHYNFAFSNRVTSTHHFALALKKYPKDTWLWEIIDTCNSSSTAYELERKYILFYDSFSQGYNSTTGGEGSHGRILSEETKDKIRQSKLGKKLTEEHKLNCSKALRGRKLTDKDKLNKSKAAKSRKYNSNSGHKGIYKTTNNKWVAKHTINRYNIIHLGTFDSIEQAIKAKLEYEINHP
jgi:group I intron endonuclease